MLVRPGGDRTDDGSVCVHFTLPIAAGPQGNEAALRIARQMGLTDLKIAHVRRLDQSHSHYLVYGRTEAFVDVSQLDGLSIAPTLPSREALIAALTKSFADRTITVVAAACSSDAHTVGLDAILGAKGIKGEPGLESYPCFRIINLGRQVEPQRLAEAVREHNADVVLISQTVSQQGLHRIVLVEVMEALNNLQMRSGRLVICGGADVTSDLAAELAYDGAFGRGSSARNLVNFVIENSYKFMNSGGGK